MEPFIQLQAAKDGNKQIHHDLCAQGGVAHPLPGLVMFITGCHEKDKFDRYEDNTF